MGKIEKTILFGGLNNQNPPTEVGIDNSVIAVNVDFLDDKSCSRRSGENPVASSASTVNDMSEINNGSLIIFRNGTNNLSSYDGITVVTNYSLGAPGTGMLFQQINEIFAIANSKILHFYTDVSTRVDPALTAPLDGEGQFKAKMNELDQFNCFGVFAGHFLVGTDDGIIFSDAYNIFQYDTRDYLLATGFAVKHIGITNNGIWAAGDDQIVFLAGETIGSLEYEYRSDEGVIAMVFTRRSEWGENEQEAPQYAALMTNGVFLLNDDGSITDLSDQDYRPPQASNGVGVVRDINGSRQAIFSFTNDGSGEMYSNKTEAKPVTGSSLDVSGTGDNSGVTAVAVNLKTGAISEYTDLTIQSFAYLNGTLFASINDSFATIDNDTDDGAVIEASYLSGVTDLPNEGQYGTPADAFKQKSIIDIYLGMTVFVEAGTFWMRTDEITSRRYLYSGTSFTTLGVRNIRIRGIGKGIKGRYWQFGYENVSGSDFRIESVLAAGARLKRNV